MEKNSELIKKLQQNEKTVMQRSATLGKRWASVLWLYDFLDDRGTYVGLGTKDGERPAEDAVTKKYCDTAFAGPRAVPFRPAAGSEPALKKFFPIFNMVLTAEHRSVRYSRRERPLGDVAQILLTLLDAVFQLVWFYVVYVNMIGRATDGAAVYPDALVFTQPMLYWAVGFVVAHLILMNVCCGANTKLYFGLKYIALPAAIAAAFFVCIIGVTASQGAWPRIWSIIFCGFYIAALLAVETVMLVNSLKGIGRSRRKLAMCAALSRLEQRYRDAFHSGADDWLGSDVPSELAVEFLTQSQPNGFLINGQEVYMADDALAKFAVVRSYYSFGDERLYAHGEKK